jgi:hypothetical protein
MTSFESALESIKEVHEQIIGLTFEQAYKQLQGFNKDDNLFDYYVDENVIGTIHNNNGMAFMDTNDSFYEYWEDDECLWAMTEDEIAEQADRLA